MNRHKLLWLSIFLFVAGCPTALAQAKKPAPAAAQMPATETQKKNIQAYIDLIRSNVRQEKSQIMGAVMHLGVDEATKFWPIYSDYDAELTKVNNLRSDNIQEYSRVYEAITDEKADELIKRALDYQRQRGELLGKYYERVKEALGAILAARFVQVENQLLLLIDLQIASSLPVVGQQ